MSKFPFIFLLTLFLAVPTSAQEQYDNSGKEKINYRRIESSIQYPVSSIQQPKEQVFPLGWNTRTLGKVTTGTGVWTELNPNVPRVDYIGIDFINPDTGWACGGSGAIIKTTNGGEDWTISETPVTNILLKIHSYNGQVVIATGFDGIILRSEDGGENFVEIPSGVSSGTDLWGVQMLNDTLGWVCGMNQTLLKTTDAGITWQFVTPGLNEHYWSLNFLSEQYGMLACGGGKVLKTTDGGISWQQYQAGDTRALFTVDIIDTLHIIAAGAGIGSGSKNVYSSDGGVTWIQNANMIYENGVNCIAFINTDTGYAVGENWVIRKTTNRGVSWFASDPVGSEWWIKLLPNGYGYTAGDELQIFKTEGGYDNWEKLFFTDNIDDVFFVDENKGFIIVRDPARLYKTTDAGQSWDSIPGAPGGVELLFLDSQIGFIGSNLIYKTTDGGENWYATNGSGGAGKIFFINSIVGWAVRSNVIYKTIDAGENWFTQLTLPTGIYTSIHFIDTLYGWSSIVGKRPFKTTDGGDNWIEQTNLNIWESRDVFLKNLLNGFMLESNKFYKTTDGGLNWVLNSDLTGFSVGAKFSYYDNSTIFIIGYKTYRTIDGGENWEEFTELDGILISGLNLLSPGDGFAVGNYGLILKYNDDSVPVEIANFTATLKGNKVILKWVTATETNNQGFFIERKEKQENEWKVLSFIQGTGTTTEKRYYTYKDDLYKPGEYTYRLRQIDYNGHQEYIGEVEIRYINSTSYHLSQNYPNPFNPNTKINFSLTEKTFVIIKLFDITGKEIETIVNEVMNAGYHSIQFSSEGLSSGVYFYKMITSSGYINIKKLTIIK